ncbi:MAG: hypothetical protein ACPGLY_25250 [Rubripirellula sp.]
MQIERLGRADSALRETIFQLSAIFRTLPTSRESMRYIDVAVREIRAARRDVEAAEMHLRDGADH